MKDLSGQTVKSYELHDLIGAGGFGAVYRAYQPVIKRDVAMKIILPDYANHPEFIRRFEFEAQLVARLEHIHIVPLYDYWREPDGAFLVMRWLRGGSLRSMLKEGTVDNALAVSIIEQVGSALAAAHRRGVVHRDLKPDNILFDEERNAYLADFGIAKDLRDSSYSEGGESEGEDTEGGESTLTGSPFYLSPEQAQSQPVTPQADIYSLGIVMYEILTGHPPFMSEQGLMGILLHHIQDPVPPLQDERPDLPPDVDTVIQRATAKDPASRYADALSLAVDFRRALGSADAQAAPAGAGAGEGADVDEVLVITRPISPATLVIVPDEELANPYKGLQAFNEADAEDFFGREALVETLLDRLQEPGDISRFLAVIGPSGSGKSSAVKAGLIPALRKGALPGSERWYIVDMVPGTDPFRELATALLGVAIDPPENLLERLRTNEHALVEVVDEILPAADDDAQLLITIDQFEEVFVQVEDEAARAHFLQLLLMAIAQPGCRVRLIITLRADFYDRPLSYAGFGEMVRRRNEVVLPLSPDEMRAAIVGPAERNGLTVETGLVAAIVAEIAEQPGGLPLMQYALTEVFERREGNVLTLDAYHESGGVLGALARRAEEIYQETDPAGQDALRQVFLRLVTLGEGTEDTRRRVHQAELMSLVEDEEVVTALIDKLGKYRLLTFDRDPDTRAPTVAVAHEALIREWKRLRGWLDDNREDILLQRRLLDETDQWHAHDRDESFLASGLRLQQFEGLIERGTLALTPDEIEYVEASVAERERKAAEEAARQAREEALRQRAFNLMRALATGAAVAAVIMLVLAVFALINRQEAVDQRENAEEQRTTAEYNAEVAARNAQISDSLALVANAQREFISKNRDLAIALALKAVEIPDPPVESRLMLAQAAFSPGTRFVLEDHGTYVFGAAFSPDGSQFVSTSFDQMVFLWDTATGEVIRQFEGHEAMVRPVDFSPDGRTVLSGANDWYVILWNVETGEEIHRMEGHEQSVRGVDYCPDGATALSGANDGLVILWDLETGEELQRMEGHEGPVLRVACSPDGTTALSSSADSTVRLWDLETGEEIRQFLGHDGWVVAVNFSPDGTLAVSGGQDRTVRMWDVATGEEVRRFQGHGSWVQSAMFSADQRRILSAGDDATLRLWNAETGDELERFEGHEGSIQHAVFSPDETQALSASLDWTLRLWDLTNGAEIRRFTGGHADGVLTADISPDGSTAITGDFSGMVYIWDVATGEQIGVFEDYAGIDYVEPLLFAPDGEHVLSASPSEENNLQLWDVATGEIVREFVGHEDTINSAFFSPDGSTFVSVAQVQIENENNGRFIMWDVATGEQVCDSGVVEYVPRGVAYRPDGATFAVSTAAPDNAVRVWDAASCEELSVLEGHESGVNEVRYSPDGTLLASASDDTRIILWDAASGAIVGELQGHSAAVARVVFSPDGNVVASASEDGTLRLWDVASGAIIRQYDIDFAVNALAYHPDGEAVLTGADDATVRLWDATPLSLERLIDWTHTNRYIPELTCRQREQFRVEPTCDEEGVYPTSTPYAP